MCFLAETPAATVPYDPTDNPDKTDGDRDSREDDGDQEGERVTNPVAQTFCLFEKQATSMVWNVYQKGEWEAHG